MKRVQLKGLTWDDPRGYGPLRRVSQAYAAYQQDVEVALQWDIQPLSGFESRPLEELVGIYDLIVADHPHMVDAAQQNLLLPFDGVEDRFVGLSYESYCFDGRLWAVPVDAACHLIAYHPDRVEHPPSTWDEIQHLAAAGVRFTTPLAGVHALMALLTLVASQVNKITSPFVELTEDQCAAGLQLLRDLRANLQLESLSWNPIDALKALASNKCDCVLLTFGYAHFQANGIRFAPVPGVLPNTTGRGVLGGAGMAVSARSRHADTAMDFAKFCALGPTQANEWCSSGGQPAHQDAWSKLARHDPYYSDTRGAIESAMLRPRSRNLAHLQQVTGAAIGDWLSSGSSNPTAIYPTLSRLYCCLAA